jgi:2-oxoglutarate ferredoxin oxidoreductase subunit beta
MKKIYSRPRALTDKQTHYCPGCSHGIVHRLIAEIIDELDIQDNTVVVCPVGCSVLMYDYFDTDCVQAAHGRAPAVATGLKRVLPDQIILSYQGDGDLAAIGTAEIVHAAARNEKITVVFINNAIYGMTGGQMAPTTLVGQSTQTSPGGRDPHRAGYPIQVAELLSTIKGATYVERVSVHNPVHVNRAKMAIKKAFKLQIDGKGFSLVEVLAACPTNWRLAPNAALEWLEKNMIQYYPLGVFKEPEGGEN